MKKAFISTVLLALVFSMALSFASCDGDDDATKENISTTTEATQTNAPQATEKQTEKATDAQTDTPDATEPAEDPATDAAVTDAPITNAPATNAPETSNPAKDTTKAPETSAPAEDTTKAPETEAPAEDPTSTATTKPEEDTTAPATTAPGQDPNVDYSQWGKHGFENLIPIPLPFSDEEADWVSKRDGSVNYYVRNDKKIRLENPDDFIKIFKEYVESFEAYGYMVTLEQYAFAAQYKRDQLFYFQCGDGYVTIDIYYCS